MTILLEDMGLSVRAYNCLKNDGYSTAEEVAATPDNKLMKVPNLGRKSIREISQRLRDLGFSRAPYIGATPANKYRYALALVLYGKERFPDTITEHLYLLKADRAADTSPPGGIRLCN